MWYCKSFCGSVFIDVVRPRSQVLDGFQMSSVTESLIATQKYPKKYIQTLKKKYHSSSPVNIPTSWFVLIFRRYGGGYIFFSMWYRKFFCGSVFIDIVRQRSHARHGYQMSFVTKGMIAILWRNGLLCKSLRGRKIPWENSDQPNISKANHNSVCIHTAFNDGCNLQKILEPTKKIRINYYEIHFLQMCLSSEE